MTTDEPLDATPAKEPARPETPEPSETPGVRPDPSDLSIAFTPRQILGGFALLAALVMLLRRKRREPD